MIEFGIMASSDSKTLTCQSFIGPMTFNHELRSTKGPHIIIAVGDLLIWIAQYQVDIDTIHRLRYVGRYDTNDTMQHLCNQWIVWQKITEYVQWFFWIELLSLKDIMLHICSSSVWECIALSVLMSETVFQNVWIKDNYFTS